MVSGYTQLLKRRYAGKLDPEAGEYIDFAVDGVKRMQTLINDLLTYSRVATRGRPFDRVALDEVRDQALANLTQAIADTGAVVESEPLPEVFGDRTLLVQLFQNLIGNAIKFHSAGVRPEIHLAWTWDETACHVVVRDNGIGIEPQYREKVFVIFQRLHTREQYPGTGIGLALAKKIVERHGGAIWFEPVPGRGTAFHFTLSNDEARP